MELLTAKSQQELMLGYFWAFTKLFLEGSHGQHLV